MLDGNEHFFRVGSNFRRAAATGQSNFGLAIVTDQGGVQISVAINLCGTQKADTDMTALQPVAEHFRY